MTPGERTLLACGIVAGFLLFLFADAIYGSEKRVSARTEYYSSVLVCTVPFDLDNRWLDMGIQGYFSHGQSLDERSPKVFRIPIPTLDCEGQDTVEGICEVFYGRDKFERASVSVPCLNR